MGVKEFVTVFFKIFAVIWWLIGGIIITVFSCNAKTAFYALGGLFALSIWVALSGAVIYLTNEKWIERKQRSRANEYR